MSITFGRIYTPLNEAHPKMKMLYYAVILDTTHKQIWGYSDLTG